MCLSSPMFPVDLIGTARIRVSPSFGEHVFFAKAAMLRATAWVNPSHQAVPLLFRAIEYSTHRGCKDQPSEDFTVCGQSRHNAQRIQVQYPRRCPSASNKSSTEAATLVPRQILGHPKNYESR